MESIRQKIPTLQGVLHRNFWEASELFHVLGIKCGLKTSNTVCASQHAIRRQILVKNLWRQTVTLSQFHGNKTSGSIVNSRAITSRVWKSLEVEDLAWKF
jgi:hypothetical protein